MNMRDLRRKVAAKGEDVKKTFAGWKTYVPNTELDAGGRRELRKARREKRRKRIAELKARSAA